MKRALLLTGGALALLTGISFAGPNEIMLGRVRNMQNQNNAQQGVTPAQPAQPPSAGKVQLTPEQQSLNRFQLGLAAIKLEEPVVESKKDQLAKDLQGAVQGSNKPALTAVKTLVDDLCAALVQRPPDAASRVRLVHDFDLVLNPAKYQPDQLAPALDDIQVILETTGLTRQGALNILGQLKAVSKTGS